MTSKAWPYEEARKLLKRWPDGKPGGDPMLFETGYGPSGLPHIGTFNEVLRTTMVRRAYEELTGLPTRLIAFSDDMDGLRKVPDNIPNADLLAANLGKPLSRIPDPFGTHDSFAAHNNALLRGFLDRFGFDYEFVSSTDILRQRPVSTTRSAASCATGTRSSASCSRRCARNAARPIRRSSRSRPTSGIVLQVPVEVVDAEAGTIAFTDDDGTRVTQSALGGKAKLQWKVDWAMRWVALGVDYEMAGKDLIDSTIQSGKIARVLGGRPPEGFNYEMFLDEKGEKISKSKGNGLSLEQWLTYGSEESLSFYAYREPKKAKSLHIGVIPRAVDEYYTFRANYAAQPVEQKLGNPVHHIHAGQVPDASLPLTYGLLLNLASLPGVSDKATAWKFVQRYAPGTSAEANPELDNLIGLAVNYARDYVAPTLHRRAPVAHEIDALRDLDAELARLDPATPGDDIQTIVFEVGKRHPFESLRHWFQALYETLLGSQPGPAHGQLHRALRRRK